MNYARRLAHRAVSKNTAAPRKARAAVKDQRRRGFFAERLEDRSLMAADLLSAYHNYSNPTDVDGDYHVSPQDVLAVINTINAQGARQLPASPAEGESTTLMVDVDNDGSVTASDVIRVINFINANAVGEAGNPDNKATYTLQVLDSSGNPVTNATTRTATIQQGSDFYVQLVGQDIRPAGTDPVTHTALQRGIFSAYTDILFDTTFATPAVNEVQSISFTNESGTVTLTLPTNASGKSGTTAPIAYSADGVATAANIQSALNTTLFGSSTANGVTVSFDSVNAIYNVKFVGINNVNLPTMTSNDPANVTISESSTGDPTNVLGAVTYELTTGGAVRYPNGQAAGFVAGYGLDDVGAFAGLTSLGRSALPVFRVHMVANTLPVGTTSQNVLFTPDPLGDGSSSTQDMKRPDHNTAVYGNDNVTVPGSVPPQTVELEKSLVTFGEDTQANPADNEFAALNPVTVAITSGPVFANSFTATPDIVEDSGADTIDLLSHAGLNQGSTGTVEVKSVQGLTAGAGTVVKSGGNAVYTPAADFNGAATFTYTVGLTTDTDPSKFATATVTVNVLSKNDVPTLDPIGNLTISEDAAQTVNLTGISPGAPANESTQTVTITATSSNTSIVPNPTVNYTTGATGTLTFTPVANASGTATITVTAQDNGGTANGGTDTVTRTFTVTVNAVNDAPINSLNGTAIVDNTAVVAIPNQTFVFSAHGKTISVSDVDSNSVTTTLTLTGTAVGTLHVDPTTGVNITGNDSASVSLAGSPTNVSTALLSLAFTPPAGSVAAENLTIASSDGSLTTTNTLIVQLDPGVRPFPLDDVYQINEGTTAVQTLDVLANDFVAPGATTTIVNVGQPPAGQGSVVINNNKIDYTPPADTNFFTPTTPVQFTYTIHDDVAGSTDRTATVGINIKNIPDTPIAVNDGPYGTTFDNGVGTPTTVTAANGVLANDTDIDNNYGVSNYATLTAVVASSTTKGTLTLNPNGSFTYTPTSFDPANPNDTFTYTVHAVTPEGTADSAAATVTIHVTTPPTATSDHFNVLEQGNPATSGNVLTGTGSNPPSGADVDSSDNQSLTAVLVSNITTPGAGSVTLNSDGSFTYNPEPNANFNTTRPPASDLKFTYQAKTSDGRLSHVATVSLTVQEVNDPPTAANDTFLAVKQNATGTIGVDQPVNVLKNDSIAPDIAVNNDEHLSVVGVGLSAGGAFSAGPVATAGGGSVRIQNGVVLYTAPTTIPAGGHDTFFYQISDNSDPSRSGPLFASASVDVNVVDFVPKTVSGSIYVDSNGDGLFTTGEKALSGITVHLTGTDITNSAVNLTAVTDASGHYTFPADQNVTLKPPLAGTSYTLTEDQPAFMLNGLDTDLSTNVDTTTNSHLVVNSSRTDNSFLLSWSITDLSGNINGLNFGEGAINTNASTGGLTNSSGFRSELLASSGKNGFVAAVDLSGNLAWSWTLEGDVGAWAGHALASATLSSDLTTLTVVLAGGETQVLTQGYLSSTSTARFRILGSGTLNGQTQYIIRIDASYDGSPGTSNSTTGMSDGMFASSSLQAAEGEAPVEGNYANSADAVFTEQAWA